jgi:predicted RNA-binding protein with PUA-like domain
MPGYWLMKSEPEAYSIVDLEHDERGEWDGVRNYQARNFMRDDMKLGDLVLYYHSNADPPGIMGLARVVREGFADHTAFDPKSKYFDPKSDPESPTWVMVELEYVEKFDRELTLPQLKADPALAGMRVVQRGQRLSVQPVEREHFEHVLRLAGAKTQA